MLGTVKARAEQERHNMVVHPRVTIGKRQLAQHGIPLGAAVFRDKGRGRSFRVLAGSTVR